MGCSGSKNPYTVDEAILKKAIAAGPVWEECTKPGVAGDTLVGYYSNHGWETKKKLVGKGKIEAKPNQDTAMIAPKVAGIEDLWVLGVYDGNGTQGEIISECAAYAVLEVLEKDPTRLGSADPSVLLKRAFADANRKACEKSVAEESGSTGTVVIYNASQKLCCIGNVGDTDAYRVRENTTDADGPAWTVTKLTVSHKASDPEEKKRITEAGGFVLDDEDTYGAARVFDNPDPVGQMQKAEEMKRIQEELQRARQGNMGMGGVGMGSDMDYGGGLGGIDMAIPTKPWPGLACSRVLGHRGVDRIGIIPIPDTQLLKLDDQDKCLILASDGIWDFVSGEEAAEICRKMYPQAATASKAIVEIATQRWNEDDPNYRDDISCIVVYIPMPSMSTTNWTPEKNPIADQYEKDHAEKIRVNGADPPPAAPVEQEDEAPAAGDEEAKKKKATKEQRRRSVVTSFG